MYDISLKKKCISSHFVSKCVPHFKSFLRKSTVETIATESDLLPLFLSFLVLFGHSLMALCRGMGAAAAVEQRWLGVFRMPGIDDNKML